MPRTVQMRACYRDDAAYLLRLEGAVAKDERRSDAWRKKAIGLLHKVAILFLEADSQGMEEPTSKKSAAGG